MNYRIVPMEERYVENYHAVVDSVARERAWLAFLEAPPLESTREFVDHGAAIRTLSPVRCARAFIRDKMSATPQVYGRSK